VQDEREKRDTELTSNPGKEEKKDWIVWASN
jgi:hypothetical protein